MNELPFTATAQLIAPRLSLASCVRAFVTRSTLGRPLLPPAQRLNRFPASPLCSITWFIDGATLLPDGEALPQIAFGGPRSRPFVSVNPGPVRAFMVMLFPQALHALTGLELAQHVDRFSAVDTVFDARWVALSQQVLAAPEDAARVDLIEHFLQPQWQAARERGDAPGGLLADWVHALGVRAAAAAGSARGRERRIKAAAGQPMRTLRRLMRAEQSFLDARNRLVDGSLSWADLAAQRGYADQAHLCREVRSITGLSPTELARRARDDESFWVYRLWS
ncbi:AraC family transcriptional regulator [Aquincola sp. S2]|uniref:AraC family transcriptional regulator n=1 Tax=Pseudaquabacterium terrae TaxID=2732868 RepID=A0ABX2ENL7_9BURK|nr:helix-turn-helix domain-containing protein [Aquabacterium terrae]NRF70223.1 AraC family transcriptional regulator [Aquabacterium terrae]